MWGVCTVAGICNNGVISDDIEVKLVDVPSMNYLSTYVGLNAPRTAHVVDTTFTRPSDKPWPRGEIWARSKTFMTPGYWNQPAATADAFEVRHHCKALCSLVTVGAACYLVGAVWPTRVGLNSRSDVSGTDRRLLCG